MYSVYHSLSNSKQKVSRLLSPIVGKARIFLAQLLSNLCNISRNAANLSVFYRSDLPAASSKTIMDLRKQYLL